MGTRHLIIIFHDGKYKLAHYGQWDGSPEGQGIVVLKFLSDQENIIKLFANLDKLYSPTQDNFQEFNVRAQDFKNKAQSRLNELQNLEDVDSIIEEFEETQNQVLKPLSYVYPSISRDTGARILEIIANCDRPVPVVYDLDFIEDSLSCEWAYVIDFDSSMLEVYAGGYKTSAVTRFDKLDLMKPGQRCDLGANVTKTTPGLVGSWDLQELPSEERFLQEIVHTMPL
ncbi:hypothetical protein N0V93_001707 [Gnomoniopsis smithogilvyi]|uniref:Uncharacterized protein n=1 Tax=Gnomoniopsis smithogilvyi TaxID=1191159 RepID=A0A9W8Z4G5_9PEZI|nr:hypothetical protein N0V93_001707 [Gnomoniopsis smithogilvyi]